MPVNVILYKRPRFARYKRSFFVTSLSESLGLLKMWWKVGNPWILGFCRLRGLILGWDNWRISSVPSKATILGWSLAAPFVGHQFPSMTSSKHVRARKIGAMVRVRVMAGPPLECTSSRPHNTNVLEWASRWLPNGRRSLVHDVCRCSPDYTAFVQFTLSGVTQGASFKLSKQHTPDKGSKETIWVRKVCVASRVSKNLCHRVFSGFHGAMICDIEGVPRND